MKKYKKPKIEGKGKATGPTGKGSIWGSWSPKLFRPAGTLIKKYLYGKRKK